MNGMFVCDINSTSGLISNCTLTGDHYASPSWITINAAGSFAYIGDYGSTIPMTVCNITAGTGQLTGCAYTTYSNFDYPTNVVYNSVKTKAWVGNYDLTKVYLCSLNAGSGDLSACTLTPSSPPADFEYPTGIALNPAGTIMYVVSNDFSRVYKCSVGSDDSLSDCTTTGTGVVGWAGFVTPFGITLNAAGTFAYIANYSSDNIVSMCSVDATTGDLINCANTGSAFTEPLTIAIAY
jgi:DNA-binding beta-propeller fold protein YncE